MALKPQSIRKGVTILVRGEELPKQDIIDLSTNWSESQEKFFKKMLKQGGKFKVDSVPYEVIPKEQILTSKGEKDIGIITIPGERSF